MGFAARRRFTDEDLMPLVGSSAAAAFAELYDRYARAAYFLAYRMMGERQAAEDLTQEALLKVWRSAGGYRPELGSVRTWVLSIVRNCGIDHLRFRARRRKTQDRVERLVPRSQPSEAFDVSWRNGQRELVRVALEALPAEQLEIVELAYFSGYTHIEISDHLDIPLGTVKSRMRLALEKLRDHFDSSGTAANFRPAEGARVPRRAGSPPLRRPGDGPTTLSSGVPVRFPGASRRRLGGIEVTVQTAPRLVRTRTCSLFRAKLLAPGDPGAHVPRTGFE
ncbi:MAG: sigma-70 family RNA polymerase sigma factor [Rubrobacter sp.]|nr:sigma-70 family RNA polymerase sigma factor [Rubrobacter sp.]